MSAVAVARAARNPNHAAVATPDALQGFRPSHLIAVRRMRALSQRGLAEVIGIKASQICTYETGAHDPTPETIDRLAAALAVPSLAFCAADGLPEAARALLPEVEAQGRSREPQQSMALDTSLIPRIGAEIRKQRIARGHTLAELEIRTGIALTTLRFIEAGRLSLSGKEQALSLERLCVIAAALQVRVNEIVGRAESCTDINLADTEPPTLDQSWYERLARHVARRRRVELRLTQTEARKRIGLSGNRLEAIETATHEPALSVLSLAAVAKLLSTSVTALLHLKDDATASTSLAERIDGAAIRNEVTALLDRVGDAVFRTREAQGIGRAELADTLGVTLAMIMSIEIVSGRMNHYVVSALVSLTACARLAGLTLPQFLEQAAAAPPPPSRATRAGVRTAVTANTHSRRNAAARKLRNGGA